MKPSHTRSRPSFEPLEHRVLFAASIDPTFGGGTVHIANIPNQYPRPEDIALLANGEILLSAAGIVPPHDAYLARYNADDGSPDSSFEPSGYKPNVGGQLTVLPDGKVFAVTRYILARYNPDGSLDVTFAGGGSILMPHAYDNADFRDSAVAPDGSIYLAFENGYSGAFSEVHRFGADGASLPAFSLYGLRGTVEGIAVRPDGELIAVETVHHGKEFTPQYTPYIKISEISPAGTIIRSVEQRMPRFFRNARVGFQSDGYIIVAGRVGGVDPRTTLIKQFRPDFSLNRSFGARGRISLPTELGAIVILPNDELLVGRIHKDRVIVKGFTSRGRPDRSFSLVARVEQPESSHLVLGVQDDGKYVIAVTEELGGSAGILMIRVVPGN